MIELLHLPEQSELVTWFPGQGASTNTTGWRVWTKPRGVNMVSMVLIGSGAGGGGGTTIGPTFSGGGGGGGGSSGISHYMFPAWMLPDRLYVLCNSGGVGGAAGVGGTAGSLSYVSVYPLTFAGSWVGVSGAAVAIGGNPGTSGVGGAGGTAGTVAVTSSAPLGQMALTQAFIAGNAGTSGGISAAGTDYTISTGCPILGGAGGAGKTSTTPAAGGGYPAVASTLLSAVPGGPIGVDGCSGFIHANGRYYYGGTGGGSSITTTGGAGGNGTSWGSGGGGGGAGSTPGTGGRGGDGGPGLVVISCW